MPRQKTREELQTGSTSSKQRTKPCRIRLTQSRKSSNRRTKTRGKTSASLRCRLA